MTVTAPRYVKPETVHIGDVIRVTVKVSDTEQTTMGRVAEREYQGSWRALKTELGVALAKYNPNIDMENRQRITLIEAAPSREQSTPLFDMEM